MRRKGSIYLTLWLNVAINTASYIVEVFFCMFILPATRTSLNDISPNTAYIYPIQNWNMSFKVTYFTSWNRATLKLEEVPERSCMSQWGIACSGAEAEEAHCCLYDFPPSSEETNLPTAMVGRADLSDRTGETGRLGPCYWCWAGWGGFAF